MSNKTCIMLLNWNGYIDSIDCINSIINCKLNNDLILIDNDSADSSILEISAYLSKNKIPFLIVDEYSLNQTYDSRILIIKNNKNYGFAGGHNVAFKYLLDFKSYKYVWMLNTDAVIEESSLVNLETTMENNHHIGFVGSIINYYSDPDIIQSAGCDLYQYLGVGKLLHKGLSYKDMHQNINQSFDYLMGASLLINMKMVKDIGLMDKSYFLYSEEVDWQFNAIKKGWKLVLSKTSLIFHKESQSTRDRKFMYYYYINRASIKLIKKHYGLTVCIIASINLTIITIVRNIKSYKNILFGIRGIIDGYTL